MASFQKRRNEISEKLKDLKNAIDDLESDMQSQWDDRSEKWQEGERGEAANARIDEMSNASSELDAAIGTLDEIEF